MSTNNTKPEGKEITQADVVWHTSANYNDTADSQHCFKAVQRKTPWGDEYDSNASLCNKNKGISEDGGSFVNFDKIEPHTLHRNFACKKCQQIYDKLPLSPSDHTAPQGEEEQVKLWKEAIDLIEVFADDVSKIHNDAIHVVANQFTIQKKQPLTKLSEGSDK